ncbi:MAG: phage antirepressor KilAC domain-containing protein [Synergistaceae bacterium]|nr:phage antirepressor KilAC domain-containing protein [Synergistaceae bacterium]
MNELQIFNFKDSKLRIFQKGDMSWWVGKDVASALLYDNTRDALRKHVDVEDKMPLSNLDESQNATPLNYLPRETVMINEAGVYSLIFSSKLPAAKDFKHWVTHEVLPDIRKHGMYLGQQAREAAMVDKKAFDAVVRKYVSADETCKALEAQIRDELQFTNLGKIVAGLPGSATVADAAIWMRQHGWKDAGRNILYAYGRDKGYLSKQKNRWNLPNQKGIDDGLFCLENDGKELKFAPRTMITPKGLEVILAEFIRENYPLLGLIEDIEKDAGTIQTNI